MPDTRHDPTSPNAAKAFDAVIIGAGFAGLYALHRLRGLGLSVRVFETGSGPGGTWYWNRYPGARCDVESMDYSYSFSDELQQEWQWTERFATQPEILRYANHVADRFDLRRDIQFETRIVAATFDETADRWRVRTDGGEQITAKFCIMATGCLSAARVPDFKGLETFKGNRYHTGNWPHQGVDFTGRRVGIIGTGSSGIQSIPQIARQAGHLFVFQRTPNFSIPAKNAPLDPEYVRNLKAVYPEYRHKARYSSSGLPYKPAEKSALESNDADRRHEYESRWKAGGTIFLTAFNDLLSNRDANTTAADFVRAKIHDTVREPHVAAALAPTDHPIGTKRICVDSGYYETFNQDNVTLVDVRSAPIEKITPNGIRTRDAEYALDDIVFATGFDAMTGAMLSIDIKGTGGETLARKWAHGPRTYLGLMIAGFPNLFMITGPGSPSVLSNMIMAIEQHVDWIATCLDHLRTHGQDRIEATVEAEDSWVADVNAAADKTLYPLANSWYVGANIPGKSRVFMPYVGGLGTYRKKCDEVTARGYPGFALTRSPATTAARPD